MRFLITILLYACYPALTCAQDTLTLLFVGDVMMHQMQINSAKTLTGYELDDCFIYVKPQLEAADITIANLEVTLAGEPHSGYPTFSAPDELAVSLKRSGVDVLVTANNHSCDKGKKGVVRTIKVLDSLKIPYTGTFYDSIHRQQTYPMILQMNNISMALLNYTYGTNGIPVPEPTMVNRIDTIQMAADIRKAQTQSPDIIIVAIHWGDEYKLYPNSQQKQLTDFLIRKGVRLIIGSHPHVLQGMEMRYGEDSVIQSAVVYSLGNYISNMTAVNTEIGATATIRLIKENNTVKIDEGSYAYTWVHKPQIEGKRRFYVLPAALYAKDSTFFVNSGEFQRLNNSLAAMRDLYRKTTIGFKETID
jgi:poly-gamma-glutamate synthesis protein (capsule biosynthesis protein)